MGGASVPDTDEFAVQSGHLTYAPGTILVADDAGNLAPLVAGPFGSSSPIKDAVKAMLPSLRVAWKAGRANRPRLVNAVPLFLILQIFAALFPFIITWIQQNLLRLPELMRAQPAEFEPGFYRTISEVE